MTGAPAASRTGIAGGLVRGRGWPAAAWVVALAGGGAAALAVALDADVVGVAAVPDVARAALATVVVFSLCGLAPAIALTPAALAPWWPAFVLPLGAVTSGLALTLLGFAAVPFHVALALVLVVGALVAWRAWPARPRAAADYELRVAWTGLACLALLLIAVVLVPTFRSGFATVTGYGSDAHLVTGSATFLQHNYPSSTNVAYPVDQVPPLWRSKFPIYYALAAVSSVGGLEPWQALMTVAAIVLILAGVGFFVLARSGFGAPLGAAAAAMAVTVLDRQVVHLAMHPYYNQLWGMLTLPWSLVAAWQYVRAPARRTLALFALVTLVGAFAYPLMLPFPLLAAAGFWLAARRERRARGEDVVPLDPRRLWHGRRSLVWMVPLALLLVVPIAGIVQKVGQAISIVGSPHGLEGWQGDLQTYPPTAQFFAVPHVPVSAVVVLALLGVAFVAMLRVAPPALGRPLAVVLAAGLGASVYFRAVQYGQYFYFKVLSFTAPQLLMAAVAGLGVWSVAARGVYRRTAALAALVAVCALALMSARDEIKVSFDQLTPETLQLRDWADTLPPGASIRLDTPPATQLWQAYMLSTHPLGSRLPINGYPHVPVSAGADYALDQPLLPPPVGAVGAPLRRNAQLRLWRIRSRAPDRTSRRMIPIFARNAPALGGG